MAHRARARVVTGALVAAAATACANADPDVFHTAEGFEVVYAAPTAEDRRVGGDFEAPTRCFAAANTLVVGPEPGCATLRVVGRVADGRVCDGSPPLEGSPVRIVRRGELPVSIRLEDAYGSRDYLDTWVADPPGWPVSTTPYGVYPLSTPRSSDCCGGLVAREWDAESGGYVASYTNVAATFTATAIDDTVELVAQVGREELFVVACTLPLTETRLAFRESCRARCQARVDCGQLEDYDLCARDCESTIEQRSEACLDARTRQFACELAQDLFCGGGADDCAIDWDAIQDACYGGAPMRGA